MTLHAGADLQAIAPQNQVLRLRPFLFPFLHPMNPQRLRDSPETWIEGSRVVSILLMLTPCSVHPQRVTWDLFGCELCQSSPCLQISISTSWEQGHLCMCVCLCVCVCVCVYYNHNCKNVLNQCKACILISSLIPGRRQRLGRGTALCSGAPTSEIFGKEQIFKPLGME